MNDRRVFIVLLIILLMAGMASAQEFRGRVQGLVSDQGGGVVPGATAVLNNDATGVSTTRQTNSEGRCLFDYVNPGTYALTVR